MPTDLTWTAVSLSFRLNRYLWKTPLSWDPVRKRFLYKPGGPRIFYWWYLVNFGAYVGITGTSCLYVIQGQIYGSKPKIKISFLVTYVMAFLASWLAAAIALFVGVYGEHAIQMANQTIRLHEGFLDVKKDMRRKKILFGIPIPSLLKIDGKLDKPGLALVFILAPLPFVAYFLVPMSVLVVKNDVFQFVLKDIIPASVRANPIANIILIIVRLGLLFVPTVESTRLFPFLIFILGIPGMVVTEMVESLENLKLGLGTSQIKWSKTLKHYTALRLTFSEVEPDLARQALVLMGFGLLLSSALNFASIRFIDSDMPFGIYVFYPFLACGVITIIIALLPVAIGIHENTKKTLKKWERTVGAKDVQLRKRIQATKALKVYSGLNGFYLFCFDKTVMSTYMMAIVENTINLLMSVPKH